MSAGTTAAQRAALLVVVALVLGLVVVDAPAAADGDGAEARTLLTRAARAASTPHVGRVTVVTFADDGPVVRALEVRVRGGGAVELRTPGRYLVDAAGQAMVRDLAGTLGGGPPTAVVPVVPEAALRGRTATVGATVALDTGPAVPVTLTRDDGPAVSETLFVDEATGLLVRRETRGAGRGELLRVVAYTRLDPIPAATARIDATPMVDMEPVRPVPGWAPTRLGGGFELVGVEPSTGTARYSDGLSVLSLYRDEGMLDVDAVAGADVRELAGRTVWTWDGSEPRVVVWTDGSDTWTAVSDAPLPVLERPLGTLPGRTVGHDLGSRIVRGLRALWELVTGR